LLLHRRAFRHIQDDTGIHTEVHCDKGKYYRAYADGASAPDSRAAGTAVFHIVALARVSKAHIRSPGRIGDTAILHRRAIWRLSRMLG
jgi:hypothetical protein